MVQPQLQAQPRPAHPTQCNKKSRNAANVLALLFFHPVWNRTLPCCFFGNIMRSSSTIQEFRPQHWRYTISANDRHTMPHRQSYPPSVFLAFSNSSTQMQDLHSMCTATLGWHFVWGMTIGEHFTCLFALAISAMGHYIYSCVDISSTAMPSMLNQPPPWDFHQHSPWRHVGNHCHPKSH